MSSGTCNLRVEVHYRRSVGTHLMCRTKACCICWPHRWTMFGHISVDPGLGICQRHPSLKTFSNSLLPRQVLTEPSLSPRSPGLWDMACCVKTILELKPQRNTSCGKPVEDEQNLYLGSTGSIYCPSLSCQSGVQSPEMTWYQVWMDFLKLV